MSGPMKPMNNFTAPMFTGNMSFKPLGYSGGLHDTLVCNNNGIVDCHTTVEYGGNTIMRETNFGQTRLTDFFNPTTGKVYR